MTQARFAILMALTLVVVPGAATAAAKRPAGAKAAVKSSTPAPGAPSGAVSTEAPGTTPDAPTSADASAKKDDMTIPSGQEGAVFKSLTVEGEDRVHFEFERPALSLELDPSKAPGLDWGSARDVLNRTVPDFGTPMLQSSSQVATPWIARPWLARFQTGADRPERIKARPERLESENRALRDRIGLGRWGVERLLARIQFLAHQT